MNNQDIFSDWMVISSLFRSCIEFIWGDTSAHSKHIFRSLPLVMNFPKSFVINCDFDLGISNAFSPIVLYLMLNLIFFLNLLLHLYFYTFVLRSYCNAQLKIYIDNCAIEINKIIIYYYIVKQMSRVVLGINTFFQLGNSSMFKVSILNFVSKTAFSSSVFSPILSFEHFCVNWLRNSFTEIPDVSMLLSRDEISA